MIVIVISNNFIFTLRKQNPEILETHTNGYSQFFVIFHNFPVFTSPCSCTRSLPVGIGSLKKIIFRKDQKEQSGRH